MADSRSATTGDGSNPSNRRVPIVVRPVPSTHSGPHDADALDVASVASDPTDDTPTTISRTPPRQPQSSAVEIRGHRLAHFELIEQIGVGGMAAVLKARDTQLDRTVALKILPPDLAAEPDNVERFQHEARAAAKLDHDNVARVFFCGEDQGLHFIAFEFVEGENLRQVMERRGGKLGVAEALSYLIQVAAGLAHAAERGVVHRDIKPSNIIVTPAGRAKLVDMGLARSLERQGEKSLTHSGVTLGTFDYISPEQALEPRDADQRSDIYSLGCTFYHVLTGRAPVPDGTAARKLHHHQHVKPTDPRELAPDLPDAVVAVLDRMMAKRPEDRYPTAAELVRELLLVARQVGVRAETPEGVRFVEDAAPRPSSNPGLLLAALAVAAVVALVFFLETPGPDPVPAAPGKQRVEKDAGPGQPPEHPGPVDPPGGPKDPPPVRVDTRTYDSRDPGTPPLGKWLAENRKADRLVIRLDRDVELLTTESPAESNLLLRAEQEVVLEAVADTRPTIRLRYTGAASMELNAVWAAVTIDAPRSRIDGVRVVVHDGVSTAPLVGLLYKRAGTHAVGRCDFFQAWLDPQNGRVASVVVDPAVAAATRLTLTQCCFLGFPDKLADDAVEPLLLRGPAKGGLDAVVLRGAADVTAEDCVFGPHRAVFTVEPRAALAEARPPSKLTLDHCTAALGADAALVELADGQGTEITVRHSLVARVGTETGDAVLVHQRAEPRGKAALRGKDNRYFGLAGGWRVGDRIDSPIGEGDEESSILEAAPWRTTPALAKLDPLRLSSRPGAVSFVSPADEQALFDAFLVNAQVAKLRTREPRLGFVGAEKRGALVATARPLPLERHERIVDPAESDPTNGVYATLDEAILAARPGDTILLRHSGPVPVKPQRLEEAAIDLTIKAAEGCQPVLTLDEKTADEAPALFRLHDGRLRIEGVEIRLQPRKAFKSQAVVACYGSGLFQLKDCLVTLDPSHQEATALSVAVLPDTDGVMKMEPKPAAVAPTPRVELENCLVRGGGDLLRAKVCRPVDCALTNTVLALAGSGFVLDGKDGLGTTPAGSPFGLRLTRATTWTTGPLLHLKAARGFKLPLPIQVTTESSLFLPAAAASLIRLEGTELSDPDKLKDRLKWDVVRSNAYGEYAVLLEQPSTVDDMPLTPETWATFSGETFVKFKQRLTRNPATDLAGLLKAVPGQFKPMDLAGIGADVAQLQRTLPPQSE